MEELFLQTGACYPLACAMTSAKELAVLMGHSLRELLLAMEPEKWGGSELPMLLPQGEAGGEREIGPM